MTAPEQLDQSQSLPYNRNKCVICMKAQIKTTGTAVLPSDKYNRVLS